MIAPSTVCAWWYTTVVSIMRDFFLVLRKNFKQTAGELVAFKSFLPTTYLPSIWISPCATAAGGLSHSIFGPSKVSMVETPHQRGQRCFCVESSGLNCGILDLTMQQRYPNASSTPALETERLNRTLRCCKLTTLTQAQVPSFSCTSTSSMEPPHSLALRCYAFCCHTHTPTFLPLC